MIKIYDVTFFSSDAILVQNDFPIIAEMYFRLNVDSREYKKVDYDILSFLLDIGGVEPLLYQILLFIFGGFLQFNSKISSLDHLEFNSKIEVDEDGNVNL